HMCTCAHMCAHVCTFLCSAVHIQKNRISLNNNKKEKKKKCLKKCPIKKKVCIYVILCSGVCTCAHMCAHHMCAHHMCCTCVHMCGDVFVCTCSFFKYFLLFL